MAHNLARWAARIGLGEQVVTTKTLSPAAVLLPGRAPHPASSGTLAALGGEVQPRPRPAASDSTPSLTALLCH